ncbi:hypothetical protein DM02DRAFT_118628 [Periconia macrospinosa]|uniref:Phosphatidic acid phosphatase type 2/haloperoxidase domain-containing protein n=1 Tax=Periconia macrospinosa TaxID=97972 RepID=A0A2V1DEE7_9PLEO|nr:hypothetical protein DM02DRAFT_118628 [Periconia macrospinosa]
MLTISCFIGSIWRLHRLVQFSTIQVSSSGLGYIGMFLAGQLKVWKPCTDLARVLMALAPFLGVAVIASSRCEDDRHDMHDVTVGILLGTVTECEVHGHLSESRAGWEWRFHAT